MKKLFLWLTVMLLVSSSAAAFRFYVNDLECDGLGKISFKTKVLIDAETGNIYPYREIALSAAKINSSYNTVKGTYFDSKNKNATIMDQFSNYYFYSDDKVFLEEGDYTLKVEYDDETDYYNFSCTEYKYSCSNINLDIKGCTTQSGYFVLVFGGLGNNTVDLREDIQYDLNYKLLGDSEYSEKMPEGFETGKIGDELYLVKVKESELKNDVRNVKVELKGCDKDFYKQDVWRTKTCYGLGDIGKRRCMTSNDCGRGEYCEPDIRYCFELNCEEGESIVNHECVSKCDDHNPCTTDKYTDKGCEYTFKEECCSSDKDCDDGRFCTIDKCADNQCSYSPNKCERADNKCVTATCSETEGCKYVVDLECRGEDKSIINAVPEYFGEELGEDAEIEKARRKSYFPFMVLGVMVLGIIYLEIIWLMRERKADMKKNMAKARKITSLIRYMLTAGIILILILLALLNIEFVKRGLSKYFFYVIIGLIAAVLVIMAVEIIKRKT